MGGDRVNLLSRSLFYRYQELLSTQNGELESEYWLSNSGDLQCKALMVCEGKQSQRSVNDNSVYVRPVIRVKLENILKSSQSYHDEEQYAFINYA